MATKKAAIGNSVVLPVDGSEVTLAVSYAPPPPGSTVGSPIPPSMTFGGPVFFALDADPGGSSGTIRSVSQFSQDDFNKLLPAETTTANVSFYITRVNASLDYFGSADTSTRGRQKELIQFKPTIQQIKALPELATQGQPEPLSWSSVFDFTTTNQGYMYSGGVNESELSALEDMPIQDGEGYFSCLYAGTAYGINKFLKEINDALGRINNLTKIAEGIPGAGLVIGATAVVAMQTAQNVADEIALALAQPTNELAFDDSPVHFVVTQKPHAAQIDGVLRIPSGTQRYVVVASVQAPAFATYTANHKVSVDETGTLQRDDGGLFTHFCYLTLQTDVYGVTSSPASAPAPVSGASAVS